MDKHTMSEEALERHLSAVASERGAWLAVERAAGYGWRAALRVAGGAIDLVPDGIIILGVEGSDSRRQALEQLALALELEAGSDAWRRRN
jgi:hypothetical protein